MLSVSNPFVYQASWPSGKARVCKTLIHGFKSRRRLKRGLFFRSPLFVLPHTHKAPFADLQDTRMWKYSIAPHEHFPIEADALLVD